MSTHVQSAPAFIWPDDDPSTVPHAIYRDETVFREEQERIFKGRIWHYLSLESELPKPGDFVSTYAGTVPVVVNRDGQGAISAFVNQCAHRGAKVVREVRGNATAHTCIYHQWTYNHQGELTGLPYRRGLNGVGGFPADFRLQEHGLRRLRVESVHGVIFGTLADDTPPLTEFLGREIVDRLGRLFARPVKVIGYQRQRVRANWKLMIENVKDCYHGALLHAFNAKFGFFRSTQRGEVTIGGGGLHSMLTTYNTEDERVASAFNGVATYRPELSLADKTMLRYVSEFDDAILTSIVSVFPSFLLLHGVNFLGFRHLRPKAPGEFEMVWTYLGYVEDDAEMDDLRLRQLNLFGAAGYVSMEDAHALELIQSTVEGEGGNGAGIVALGGRGTSTEDHLVTEVAIRGFWQGYRRVMGLRTATQAAA